MGIELQIDKIVLEGMTSHQAGRVTRSLKTELTRLFTEKELPTTFGNKSRIPELNSENLKENSYNNPDKTGANIANSIYQGLASGATDALNT